MQEFLVGLVAMTVGAVLGMAVAAVPASKARADLAAHRELLDLTLKGASDHGVTCVWTLGYEKPRVYCWKVAP